MKVEFAFAGGRNMNHHTTLARVMALDGMTRHERSDNGYSSMKGFVPSHKIIHYLLELQRRRWVMPGSDKAARTS
jgi:hypothetical protein